MRTFPAVINRREFLPLGLGAIAAYASSFKQNLLLLPLYTKKHAPVTKTLIDATRDAIERTFLIAVNVSDPALYEGACEGDAVLDFLPVREGGVMAIISAQLRAAVPCGLSRPLINVVGWADTPNDLRERPRGSVITTYQLCDLRDEDAARKLGQVAAHELGHNLGAWHCQDRTCYMYCEMDLRRDPLPKRFCVYHRDNLSSFLR